MFLIIRQHSKRRWKIDLQRRLSHRYQIMENIRTSKQLLKVLVVDAIANVYTFLVNYTSILLVDLTDAFWLQKSFIAFFMAVMAIMFPLYFIRTHPKIAKLVKHRWCGNGKRRRVAPSPTVELDSSRRQTSETARAEANIYFTQLRNSWK